MKIPKEKDMFNRMLRFLLMAGILLGMFSALPVQHARAFGTDRYVSTTGLDSGDCTVTPCHTIGFAIGVSGAATADQIHIAAGTYHENLTINKTVDLIGAGENLTIIDGGALNTVIFVNSAGIINMRDLSVQHGSAAAEGGGIYNSGNLTLLRVTVSSNTASGGGGGIYNYGDSTVIPAVPGVLSLTDVFISGNTATAGAGGGLFSYSTSDIYLSRVTVSGNTATAYSGGIHNQGAGLYLTNVTISDNTANNGGAMTVTSGSSATIVNTTIANNHSNSTGLGGIAIYSLIDMVNTIVYGNQNGNCFGSAGLLTSSGYNIDGDATCLTPAIAQPSDQPGTNPLLGPLAKNGGYVPTHSLLAGSPAIDATIAPCPVIDAASWPRPQDGNGDTVAVCDIGAFEAPAFANITSTAANDGWILELSETSNKGGSINSTTTTFRLGDNAAKKQYRSILSFATGDLPDDAVITKVTLKVRKQGIIGGGNPVTAFQGFMVDIKKGYFGTSALQTTDFQTAASKTYGPFKPALSGGWYSINLTGGKSYINKLSSSAGLTQIRLRFKLDDNNNTTANYLSLYSGNAGSSYRPQLVIEYYVP
jgi:hypothetical protein